MYVYEFLFPTYCCVKEVGLFICIVRFTKFQSHQVIGCAMSLCSWYSIDLRLYSAGYICLSFSVKLIALLKEGTHSLCKAASPPYRVSWEIWKPGHGLFRTRIFPHLDLCARLTHQNGPGYVIGWI